MKKISHFISHNPRYTRYKKPLEAAQVCQAARVVGEGRFGVISYRQGLLSLSVESPSQAANLSAESVKIISSINQKLGSKVVERLRFKVE